MFFPSNGLLYYDCGFFFFGVVCGFSERYFSYAYVFALYSSFLLLFIYNDILLVQLLVFATGCTQRLSFVLFCCVVSAVSHLLYDACVTRIIKYDIIMYNQVAR